MTRYVIVGAGAVGASLAAELHRANLPVVLIARGAHLDALREHGLRYVRPDGEYRLPIPVAAGPAEVALGPDDVLVIATKTQDTAIAVRDWAWQPVKRADGSTGTAATDLPVLTLQNGLENERIALRSFTRVLGGVIWIPAQYLVAGEVVNPALPVPAVVWLGRYPAGTDPQAAAIAADLRLGGLIVHDVPDIADHKATKLLGNLVNGLDALYRPSDLRTAALDELREEARAVFAAAGVRSAARPADVPDFRVADLPGHTRGGNSTWQSLARAGTPETDYLNGEIALLGRLHGVPAPGNAAIQARIHRAVADGTAAGSLDDADLAATLPWVARAAERPPVLIGADELYARVAQPEPAPVLLDVRWALGDPHGADHYQQGHLPGAIYVDLETELAAEPPGPAGPAGPAGSGAGAAAGPGAAGAAGAGAAGAGAAGAGAAGAGRHPLPSIEALQASARRWGITRRRGVVVYDNSGGLAAARAWWLLRWAGVPDVRILDGGLAAWLDAGHTPVSGAARPQPPSDITLDGGHLPTLTADEAAELPAHGTLLDARAGERYRGEVEPIDPRAGHIPGAISAPTTGNLTGGVPRFKPAAELRARFADLTGPIGVYCGSGVTAAHEIAALAVAGIDAALYPGSWSAWSSDPSRPVATGDPAADPAPTADPADSTADLADLTADLADSTADPADSTADPAAGVGPS